MVQRHRANTARMNLVTQRGISALERRVYTRARMTREDALLSREESRAHAGADEPAVKHWAVKLIAPMVRMDPSGSRDRMECCHADPA